MKTARSDNATWTCHWSEMTQYDDQASAAQHFGSRRVMEKSCIAESAGRRWTARATGSFFVSMDGFEKHQREVLPRPGFR